MGEHFGLGQDAWTKLEDYAHLLATDAVRLGLVGFDPSEAADEVLASLLLLQVLDTGQLVDVGSGAGLPGLPLAIARGAATLVEPRRRAVAFLEKASRALEVDIEVLATSAEELAKTERRQTFRAVTLRAVAPPPVALELGAPLAATGGVVILTSSPSSELDLSPASRLRLGISRPRAMRLTAPGDFHRSIHIVKKTGATENALPRQARSARRNPLK